MYQTTKQTRGGWERRDCASHGCEAPAIGVRRDPRMPSWWWVRAWLGAGPARRLKELRCDHCGGHLMAGARRRPGGGVPIQADIRERAA